LAAIVKNEDHIIKRMLHSVRPYVDCYYIADTGSQDETREIIRDVMKEEGLPGALFDIEWKGFGDARTKVLDKIRELNMAQLALVMDANDVLVGDNQIPDIGNADVARVLVETGELELWQDRILRMSPGTRWRYEGIVHEMPELEGRGATITKYTGFRVIDMMDGGKYESTREKYEERVKLSEMQDLQVPRNMFYYAQNLRDAGRHDEALEAYKKRAEMTGGWTQEAVYSRLMMGRILDWRGEHEKAIVEFMKCYEMDQTRTEALVGILRTARLLKMYRTGLMFGSEIGEPSHDGLFVEKPAWDLVYMELGLCHYYTGDKQAAKECWEKILTMESAATNMVEQAKKNLEYI
jgi:glycosyltransferase involved in cell wall biosynthesis